MREILNQYSAMILVVAFALLLTFTMWDFRRNKRFLAVIGVVVAVLLLGYLQMRTGPSNVAATTFVGGVLAGERPVLVEVYSDF